MTNSRTLLSAMLASCLLAGPVVAQTAGTAVTGGTISASAHNAEQAAKRDSAAALAAEAAAQAAATAAQTTATTANTAAATAQAAANAAAATAATKRDNTAALAAEAAAQAAANAAQTTANTANAAAATAQSAANAAQATANSASGGGGAVIGTNAGQARDAAAAITAETGALTAANLNKPHYDVRYFGAAFNGTAVAASASVGSGGLGLSTVAALQAYTLPAGNPYAGVHPYAGLNTGSWRHYAAFSMMQNSASGATVLPLNKIVTTSVASPAPGGGFTQIISALGGIQGVHPGDLVYNSGNSDLPANETVFAMNPQGTDGLNNGFYVNYQATTNPAVGHTFLVAHNLAPIAAALAAGQTVTVIGQYLPANDTVTAVNQAAGTITLSAAATSANSAYDGLEFVWNYTDAEAAAMTMDTLGTQAALQYAFANGGGTVFLPPGTGKYNQSVTMPISANIFGYAPYTASIDLVGAGTGSTIMQWTLDMGPGQYALPCFERLSQGSCGGTTRDLTLAGYNSHFAAGGSQMTQMYGLGWASGRILTRVNVNYFFAGYAMSGSQIEISDGILSSNYYGIYFDLPDFYGEQDNYTWRRMVAQNNGMAAFAVSPNMQVGGSLLTSFTSGSGPWAFYKEMGGNQPAMFTDSKAIMTQCEVPGIGCRGEDSPWLNNVSLDKNMDWDGLEPGAYNSFFAPGGGVGQLTAVMDMANVFEGHIRIFDGYNWHPGIAGIFNMQVSAGLLVDGDVQGMITTAGSVGVFGPLTTQGYSYGTSFGVTLRDPKFEAHTIWGSYVSGLTPHLLVCDIESTAGVSSGVATCGGTAQDNPLGVFMASGTANPQVAIIIHKGDIVQDYMGFQLPKSTPGTSAWNGNGGIQGLCTTSGGGVSPAAGQVCPNGGAKVGTVIRMDGSFSWAHINATGW